MNDDEIEELHRMIADDIRWQRELEHQMMHELQGHFLTDEEFEKLVSGEFFRMP